MTELSILENYSYRLNSALHGGGRRLLSADETIDARIQEVGAVLLRNSNIDEDKMFGFVKTIGSSKLILPARRQVNEEFQLVDGGNNAIELHCEHAYGPFRPELLIFYCKSAAAEEGETTICDGLKIWNEFSDRLKDFWREHKLLYRGTYKETEWRKYARVILGGDINEKDVSEAELITISRKNENIKYSLKPDGTLYTEFLCQVETNGKLCEKSVFASNIWGDGERIKVSLEDGGKIPYWVLLETKKTFDRLIKNVKWKNGDLLLLDNTRYFHGRNKFEDKSREIWVAMKYA